jgi:hypothetical protein
MLHTVATKMNSFVETAVRDISNVDKIIDNLCVIGDEIVRRRDNPAGNCGKPGKFERSLSEFADSLGAEALPRQDRRRAAQQRGFAAQQNHIVVWLFRVRPKAAELQATKSGHCCTTTSFSCRAKSFCCTALSLR